MNILCADDFGLTKGITEAIIELGHLGALQATSVMTESDYAAGNVSALLDSGLSAGLHFNLTHEFSDRPFALHRLMIQRRLPVADIETVRQRLCRQLDRFETMFKASPDFIDGHQHVHCFPAIRGIFLEELSRRYPAAQRPWIRQVGGEQLTPGAHIKGRIISFMNKGFKESCTQAGFTTNASFAGIYAFSPQADYKIFLKQWMRQINTLVMCHPSNTLEEGDAISEARVNEYRALKSLSA